MTEEYGGHQECVFATGTALCHGDMDRAAAFLPYLTLRT